MCKSSIVLAAHMWQDVLHNEMHDAFRHFWGSKVTLSLNLQLGAVLVHLLMEQIMQMLKGRP